MADGPVISEKYPRLMVETFLDLWHQNLSIEKISRKMHISWKHAAEIRDLQGLKKRKINPGRKRAAWDDGAFIDLWKSGMPAREIGRAFGHGETTTLSHAKELGLQRRSAAGGPRVAKTKVGAVEGGKFRTCLGGCGKTFFSKHNGNWLCDICRKALRGVDANFF